MVAEVALAVLMAAGAALLVRSVANLYAIDPGIDAAGLAVLDISLADADMTMEQRRVLLNRLTDELGHAARRPLGGAHPQAARCAARRLELAASASKDSPISRSPPRTSGSCPRATSRRWASPCARAAASPPGDRGQGPPAEGGETPVLINEALAAKYFPGEDPVGRCIGGGFGGRERIIGVVANVAEAGLTDAAAPARYWLVDHSRFRGQRADAGAARERPGWTRRRCWSRRAGRSSGSRPAVAVQEATTMELVLAEAVGPARQIMVLLTLLTALAVRARARSGSTASSRTSSRGGSATGPSGSPSASRRRAWSRRWWAAAPRCVVIGIVIGVAAAVALARLIGSLLYGVERGRPDRAWPARRWPCWWSGSLAALLPAWRAGRTEPALLLREA